MGRENHERCSKKNIPKIGGYLIMIIENKIGGGGVNYKSCGVDTLKAVC